VRAVHKLLERQLKKLFGDLDRVPAAFDAFLNKVDETYSEADADRLLLERSLDLTSQELLSANAELRADRSVLERRVEERTTDLRQAKETLEEEIAERKEAEQALREAQKMEAVGRLAGGVAHDFNNLLTAIVGYSELLRSATEADPGTARLVDEIRRAARRGADLTQQLLAFSRRQVLDPRVLDLNEVVRGIEGLLRQVIGEEVRLVTRLDGELESVRADPNRLEQVLVNLAVNARDAMPEGGEVLIETSNAGLALAGEPAVLLAVQDTGVGIPAELRSQIFDPFFTTKERGQGTGLGLSTVYGIVTQSEGRIEVESEPGGGTRFEILLPAVDERPARPAEEPAGGDIPRGHETILIAEDEPAVRTFLRRFLRKQGYRVLTAADGEEALRIARNAEPAIDLLLSDVVMPTLNGIALARRMRRARPGLRIVFMSGHPGPAGDGTPLDEEGALFLQKPFTTGQLGRALRDVLDRPAQG